jgi:hypothetical protein
MRPTSKPIIAAGILLASLLVSRAQYYVAGDFQSPQWQPGMTPMVAGPNAGEYSYTNTGGTAGAYNNLKVTDGTWANTWPSGNMLVKNDSNGSFVVHFYPGNQADGWLPLANRVGYDDPDNDSGWGIAGGNGGGSEVDFDGWNGSAGILNSTGSGVYSNTFTVGTAGTFEFKFQSPAGSWSNIQFGSDFANGGSNGSYATTNSPQKVPVSLDLPHGRYLVGNLAPSPVTNKVVFAVDMTYQIQLGYFHPGSSVYVAGGFNNWPAANTGNGLLLTNYPPYNGGSNTNIYYGTNIFIGLPGSLATQYKFNQNDASAQNGGWESVDNHNLTLLSSNGVLVVPTAVFNNLYSSEVLTADTLVTFTVDMTGAVDVFGNSFDPNNDLVLVDGDFLNPQWAAMSHWTDPLIQSDYGQNFLTRVGSSLTYTNSYIVPAGNSLQLSYKYGIYHDSGNLNTNIDNEAGYGSNHSRYVRSTVTYNLPTDIFGQQRTNNAAANEIAFGNLSIGQKSANKFPITWLGLPGVHLQYSSTIGGAWTDVSATDGANSTNWPAASGQQFFRLVRPLQ